MNVGATGNVSHATSIAVETTSKTNELARAEGKAAVKLIESAGEAAKTANSSHDRGRIIDIHA